MLEGSLLETRETLKVNHLVLEEKVFLQMTVNPIMGCLPLTREDAIVLHNHFLNPVSGQQGLHMTLLGICLNSMDLGSMSPPFPLCVINLREKC